MEPKTVERPTKRARFYEAQFNPDPVYQMSNNEFTRASRSKTLGSKQSSTSRLIRAAALNQEAVVLNYKGLGRPFQYGFYNAEKYAFVDTAITYTAMPLYAFDVTSTLNVSDGVLRSHNPMLRAFMNNTNNRMEWHPCQSQNSNGSVVPPSSVPLDVTTPEVNAASDFATRSQWQVVATPTQLVTATGVAPYQSQYLDTVDIYMNLFGARQVPTTWKIDVCQFDPDLAPYCLYNTIEGSTSRTGDERWHTSFWSNEMVMNTVHPMLHQRGYRSSATTLSLAKRGNGKMYPSKGYRSLLGKPIVITQQPNDTSFQEPTTGTTPPQYGRMHTEKITLRVRKTFNMNHTSVVQNNSAQNQPGMDIDNATVQGGPDTGVTNNVYTSTTPAQSERIFLIIKGTDYRDKTWVSAGPSPCRQTASIATVPLADAWATKINDIPAQMTTSVDFGTGCSFDLNVFKRYIKDAF